VEEVIEVSEPEPVAIATLEEAESEELPENRRRKRRSSAVVD
jgi:hypothetical protein